MTERLLKGRYELQSVLGRGLATSTHLALDHESGERCVVKVLPLAAQDALKAHELLTREARVLQRLDHPRIPRLVDFFSEEDGKDTRVCLVQQHVEGKSLLELVRAGRRFSEREALALGAKLARVLEYLHGFDPPILHRDLKPANVLLTAGERVFLVDFGAVRDHLPHGLLHPSGPTIVGTRGYMPIEQFEGRAVPGSDLYALGATLVFALAGKEPGELGKQGLRLDIQPHLSVSPGFLRLLVRLLEPDWHDRPISATELRQELERLAEQARRPRRERRALLVAALLGLVATAGLGIFRLSSRGPRETPPTAGARVAEARPLAETESPAGAWLSWLSWRSAPRDAFGDALPPQARRRLGTLRLRHGGPVRALAFTPDGASIVSASEDGTASVWSAATGEETHRFVLGARAAALAVSSDGSRLLVGADGHWSARLWELPAGRALARLLPVSPRREARAGISDVAWSREGWLVAATRTEDAVDLWSGKDGRHLRRLRTCGPGRRVTFLDRGMTLLVDCPDGGLSLLEASSGSERRRLTLGGSHLPLRVSPDGRLLAVPSHGYVKLVDLASGAQVGVLRDGELQSGGTTATAFAPDGQTLAIGLASGKLVLFDVATRTRGRVLGGSGGPVLALAFSPDARRLASGGADHALRVFDLETGEERLAATAHSGAVRGLDFLPAGTLLSAGADATLRQWNRGGRQTAVRGFDRPGAAVFGLPPSRYVAVEEGRLHVYDVASGWEVTAAALPNPQHQGVAVALRAGLLAAGGASTLEIVDLATGARRSFPVPRREEAFAFSPDGRVLATLREEAEPLAGRPLVLRDTATGQELASLPHNRGGPYPFRCRSSDGSYFGFNGGLWRLGSDPRSRLQNHGWPGRAAGPCAVSPDGRFVAFPRDEPDTIDIRERVLGASDQPELRYRVTLFGHRGPVTALAFAPDSRTLASGGADTSILLWDVAAQGSPAEAPAPRAPQPGPCLQLGFDDGIEGPGVTPVRTTADSPLQLVAGRRGRALRPAVALAFPETRDLVLADGFTVTVAFQIGREGLRPDASYQSIVSSELVTLDVREGGKAWLFLHFIRQGGHAQVGLEPWIGRVQPERWYHVAVALHRSDGLVRVCVDGVCGPGPAGRDYSDRVGELTLARSVLWQPFAGTIDELSVYDRALSDDEMALAAGLPRAIPLPSPTPAPTPTPPPPLPAEQQPLPREGLPEGRDVAAHVSVEERTGFSVYRFGGPLARAQPLDLDVGMGAVWVGTSLGLLRHDPRTGGWRQWDETSGLPGERLDEIAVVGGRVIADSSTPSGPGNVRGTGVLAFDVAALSWSTLKDVGSAYDLWGDGSTLWAGMVDGAQALDLETGARRRFSREAGELLHGAVHAVRRHGDTVAFATMGNWVLNDFVGGGVTLWDRRTNEFRSYTPTDGLARAYSCDVFLDDEEVFVAHWDEERGLSRLDRSTGRAFALRRSANGIDLGGVVLAGERETLWIGQQGALVKLDRASRQATALRERDGLPGYIVSGIEVAADAVWASVYAYGQDGVRAAGLVRFPRR